VDRNVAIVDVNAIIAIAMDVLHIDYYTALDCCIDYMDTLLGIGFLQNQWEPDTLRNVLMCYAAGVGLLAYEDFNERIKDKLSSTIGNLGAATVWDYKVTVSKAIIVYSHR
jgi:hypothetical protein